MRPDFPLCREESREFLPPAGLCCWCYVASMKGKRDQKGERKHSLCCGQEEKNIQREESRKSDFIGKESLDKPSTMLSSSAATGYLATPSCFLQVAPSGQVWVRAATAAAADHQAVTAIYCATASSAGLKHDPHPMV